jgi:hypothetical protein
LAVLQAEMDKGVGMTTLSGKTVRTLSGGTAAGAKFVKP